MKLKGLYFQISGTFGIVSLVWGTGLWCRLGAVARSEKKHGELQRYATALAACFPQHFEKILLRVEVYGKYIFGARLLQIDEI